MTAKWKRRDFLRHTALAGLLAPVAYHFRDIALAEDSGPKRHAALVFLPNGKHHNNPFITGAGRSFSFEEGFDPYNRYRDRTIALSEYAFWDFVQEHYKGDHGGHFADALCMFTGEVPYVRGTRGTHAMAPSIDQIIAWDYLDRGVVTNPLRKTLPIKIKGSSFKAPSVFYQAPSDYRLGKTYSRELTPVTNIEDPREGFDRMFGDLAMVSGESTWDLWAQGRSILDVPEAEIERLKPTLPAEGQRILDEHLHNLRELEISLADDTVAASDPPPRPESIDRSPKNHARVIAQWVDIIDAAFRLDRTRLATMQFGGIASRFQVPELGLGYVGKENDANSGADHHSYTHWKANQVPRFMDWYAQQIGGLLDALAGDGTAARPDILSDSVVMVGMEFGHNHQSIDVPVTLFGECGGYFDTGRAVRYGNEGTMYKHTGTLLSVCHAMGVDRLDAVGHPGSSYQRGPVAELRG